MTLNGEVWCIRVDVFETPGSEQGNTVATRSRPAAEGAIL